MPPKTPKPEKPKTQWFQCEKCSAFIVFKDLDTHSASCPPDTKSLSHHFVLAETLYGCIDSKTNEEIKNVTEHEKDHLVFLSLPAMQLCGLAIGEWAIISKLDGSKCVAKRSWPTVEKSLTSVLMTKSGLTLSNFASNDQIIVEKAPENIQEAREILIVLLNPPKEFELSSELQNRLKRTYNNYILARDNKINLLFYGKVLEFEIKSIRVNTQVEELAKSFSGISLEGSEASSEKSKQFFRITEKTIWKLFEHESDYKKTIEKSDPFSVVGGLENEIEELQELINYSLSLNSTPKITGFKMGKGVLLYGASGTGKTLLANALAKWAGVNVVNICAPDLYAKTTGSIEDAIKNLFKDAVDHAPTIILLDEVDILCPSRSTRMTDTERRIVSSLLVLLDELNEMEDSGVFVLATSNKPDGIDPSFRRCGRLDREIEIPIPNPNGRYDIMKKILSGLDRAVDETLLKEVANSAHGYVGADLVSLCSRAVLHGSKRHSQKHGISQKDGNCQKNEVSLINAGSFINEKSSLEEEDFKFALTRVRPSAMREVQIEVPNVKWSDIGGQENLKLILRQAVEWPLKHAESFVRMGITPPRGVLMFGPPGCSKTMIAKALATESGLNFLAIKGPELFSKWVGESERAVREVFRKARQVAPSIIFFDEIDALGGERTSGSSTSVQERVLAQLLTELDGVTPLGDVTVLAATNRPDRIDKALIRPGRLDRIVYVPLPDGETRKEIFKLKLRKMPVVNVSMESLVEKTNGYSGAEVNAVCHEAAMMALEENIEALTVDSRHFEKALAMVTPRTSPSLIKIYEDYIKNKT